MALQIRKAERAKAKLRLGIAGPSGSGKTYSSLLMGFGLGGKVGLIDTEHGSGDLYADLGDYDVIQIDAPYTVQKYLEALHAFENGGYDVVIIDSLSHAWAGDGGLLDKQGKIADRSGNSYTAWRTVTPEHNQLVEAMLACPCHLIATVRAKQEYSQEKDDKGKTVVKKLGMAPVQREGMEYEFTVFLDVDMDHVAKASKDRTSLFDGQYFKIDKKIAKRLLDWLNTGREPEPKAKPEESADAKVDKVKLANLLEDHTTDFELSFIECGTLPDLAAQFDKAQKDLKSFVPDLGAELVRPHIDRIIKAKDTRKAIIQQPQGVPGADLLGHTDPNKMSVEDVKRLSSFAVNEGLNDEEVLEVLGVKALGDLPKNAYADATDKIMKRAREKVARAPQKAARRRAAPASA